MKAKGERVIERLSKSLGTPVETLEQAIAALSPLKYIEQAAAEMRQQDDAQKSARASAMREAFERVQSSMRKSEQLGHWGWTLPLDASLPALCQMLDSIDDEKSADRVFREYFLTSQKGKLGQLVDKTLQNPALRPWHNLLEECGWCLREQKYRVALCGLLPAFDGVCAEKFSKPAFYRKRSRSTFLNAQRKRVASMGPIDRWMWLAFIGFVQTLFRDVDFTGSVTDQPRLSRHAILHGRAEPEGTIEDCLRLLLALDSTISLSLDVH